MKDKLTARQERFVAAYEGNATEAARKAGYKGNDQTLAVTASELLRNPKVKAAIAGRQSTAVKGLIASREERQTFWTETMRDDMADLKDRLKASELLGKSEADFIERKRVEGADGGPLNLVIDIRED